MKLFTFYVLLSMGIPSQEYKIRKSVMDIFRNENPLEGFAVFKGKFTPYRNRRRSDFFMDFERDIYQRKIKNHYRKHLEKENIQAILLATYGKQNKGKVESVRMDKMVSDIYAQYENKSKEFTANFMIDKKGNIMQIAGFRRVHPCGGWDDLSLTIDLYVSHYELVKGDVHDRARVINAIMSIYDYTINSGFGSPFGVTLYFLSQVCKHVGENGLKKYHRPPEDIQEEILNMFKEFRPYVQDVYHFSRGAFDKFIPGGPNDRAFGAWYKARVKVEDEED